MDVIRKNFGVNITPTTVVLLQELERFNKLIKKMRTSLATLRRVRQLRIHSVEHPIATIPTITTIVQIGVVRCTVESHLIATEMLAFPSKTSRIQNDSDPMNEKTTPI